MDSPTTPPLLPLNAWVRSSGAAIGIAIIAYALSVALGAPLNPSRLFSFVVLPSFGLAFVVQYKFPLRRIVADRQIERDAEQRRLVQQAFRQLPVARADSHNRSQS
jgi:hypothetical protein